MMRAWPSNGSFEFREKNTARLIWRRCVNGKQTVGCCRQIPPARPMSTRLIGKGPATFLACFKPNQRRCKDQPEISDQPSRSCGTPASQRKSAIRNGRADRQVGIFWSKPSEFTFEVSFNSFASHC